MVMIIVIFHILSYFLIIDRATAIFCQPITPTGFTPTVRIDMVLGLYMLFSKLSRRVYECFENLI